MPFWRTYYHIIWTTKNRLPFITPKIEPVLFRRIRKKSDRYGGILHAIGGIEDHIHIVVSIPPKISVSDYVGKLKGSSAYFINHEHRFNVAGPFAWQDGYGVFSLGEKQLYRAVAYVNNQKQHHHQGTAIKWLETVSRNDSGPDNA